MEAVSENTLPFLRTIEPFHHLSDEELKFISEKSDEISCKSGAYIFREGEAPEANLFVVKQGSVRILRNVRQGQILLDVCDEGDCFGTRTLFTLENYISSAKVDEPASLIRIPVTLFKTVMHNNPELTLFFASALVAELPNHARKHIEEIQQHHNSPGEHAKEEEPGFKIVNPIRKVITCSEETTVKEAAALMTKHNIGCLLVASRKQIPLGILTDSDLRRKVVATNLDTAETPVYKVMNSPVITVPDDQSVSSLILRMMKQKVRHFCVTEDGTPNTPITGIISERDILSSEGLHPAVLEREMQNVDDVLQLRLLRDSGEKLIGEYLRQQIDMEFITGINTEFNDLMIRKAVAYAQNVLKEQGMEAPPEKFCWLAMGSEGRQEQLLRMAQDSAIVYEDPTTDRQAEVEHYFRELGALAVDFLESCGYHKCPERKMASNPAWNKSLSEWKYQFFDWIRKSDPELLFKVGSFFDFRAVSGDNELALELRHFLFETKNEVKPFINNFADTALMSPPPLSFFRNFIVEKAGKYKDEFDIKYRALVPLVNSTRAMALDFEILENNTLRRFEALAGADRKNEELYREGKSAYKALLRQRALEGLQNGDSGRYVNIENLRKSERQILKNAFTTIDKLQKLVKSLYR